MRHGIRHHRGTLAAPALLLLLLLGGSVAGCGDPLEVDDPTAILESEVNTAEGAELLRRGALLTLYSVTGSAAWVSGLLADEFLYQRPAGSISSVEELIDRRASEDEQEQSTAVPAANFSYRTWQELRSRAAPIAIEKLRLYARPGAREAHVGEMFAVRAYAALHLAEDFCPGFPLHEVQNYTQVLGAPVSTPQALEYALAAFDSARTWAADSARVLHFARIGRARTLLNLGRFAEAAAAVTDVPTGYVYRTEYNATQQPRNDYLAAEVTSLWGVDRSVADREGGTGLDFVSAKDPRVPTTQRGTARDGTTRFYAIGKYPSLATPIVLASGVEARLIQAEAALRTDPTNPQWLTLLNALRTSGNFTTQRNAQDTTKTDTLWQAGSGNVAGLRPLADPGTEAARVDLVFRERAFWLFATGHRLGDLRRLLRVYGRPSASVFPAGTYWMGGPYGPATSLLFDRAERDFGAGRCTGA